jgi:hypothetical protein
LITRIATATRQFSMSARSRMTRPPDFGPSPSHRGTLSNIHDEPRHEWPRKVSIPFASGNSLQQKRLDASAALILDVSIPFASGNPFARSAERPWRSASQTRLNPLRIGESLRTRLFGQPRRKNGNGLNPLRIGEIFRTSPQPSIPQATPRFNPLLIGKSFGPLPESGL